MPKTRNMILIRDERGEIIGAQVEEPLDGGVQAFITPARPAHTLHRISDVPTKMFELGNPDEFHAVFSKHCNSALEAITQISADELRLNLIRMQAAQQKKSN
jgi:hypothetical protein